MSIETERTVPARLSDDDLRWVGLTPWQIAYLSQATDDQREIVYREAIRISMSDDDDRTITGLGF